MKYIKEYSLYESHNNKEEVLNNIKDICLELEDNGFEVSYKDSSDHFRDKGNNNIYITIKKGAIPFKYRQIKDVINRLQDYIKSVGCLMEISSAWPLVDNDYFHKHVILTVKLVNS